MMESYTLQDIFTGIIGSASQPMRPFAAAQANDYMREKDSPWRWVLTREIAVAENNGGETLETASVPQNSGEGVDSPSPSPLTVFEIVDKVMGRQR